MRLVLPLVALMAACNQPVECPEPAAPGALNTTGATVASVEDAKVTQDMIDALTQGMPQSQKEQMMGSPQWDGMLRKVAVGQLLYNKAMAEGMMEDPIVQMQIGMAVRQALSQAYVQKKADASVSDDEIKKWYDERKVQYAQPQVHARHILVKEEDKAKELFAKVKAGGDFAALAMEHSTDPGSGKKGGDLGWFDKRRMVEPFADAAFAANKGDIVGPVESRFGFHIIEVLDKRDATPLEDVRPEAERALRQEATRSLTAELEKEVVIAGKENAPAPAAGGHGPGDGHGHGKPPAGKPPAGKPAPAPAPH